jgi:hypothetical protein
MHRTGQWACGLSLAIHIATILALYLATSERTESVGEMAVGTVEFDTPANVQLAAPTPQELPAAVMAMPLDAAAVEADKFDAIIPVAAVQQQPAPTVTHIPVSIHQSPPVATGGRTDSQPTFFGVQAQAKSIVYVIDRSASMGLEGRLRRATAEVAASLARLPANTRVQVIVYARTTEPMLPELAITPPRLIESASARLLHLSAEGGTDHVRALKSALALNPEAVYFLTDEDELTPADVKAVCDYNRGRSAIHTICLVDPAAANTPLQDLAKRNRGEFRVVK